MLTFRAVSQEDVGRYWVELSDQPALSSGYTLTQAELQRLTELSLQVRNPRTYLHENSTASNVRPNTLLDSIRLYLTSSSIKAGISDVGDVSLCRCLKRDSNQSEPAGPSPPWFIIQ